MVKNPPANAGDVDVGSIPGSGRSPEEGMETYFRILTWGIPWTEKPGRLKSTGTQRVGHKGNQSWMFIGRTDVEAETPILWPSDANNRLIGKDPDVGKD